MWAWGTVIGCSGPTEPTEPSTPDGTHSGLLHSTDEPTDPSAHSAHTGTEIVDSGLDAITSLACVLQPGNALRVDCTATVDPPQPIEIRYQKADGTGKERVHQSPDAASEHSLTLWYLAPDTEYRFTAVPQDPAAASEARTVRTQRLPLAADVVVATTGTSTAELFLTTSPCVGGAAVIWDPATEEVLWYQDLTVGPGGVLEGVDVTDDGTILGLGGGGVQEYDLAGGLVNELRTGVDFTNRIHHDAFKRNGLTYVLFSEEVYSPGQVTVDGFYVFDSAGLAWEWHLVDFVTPDSTEPSEHPGDWSHANSVWADASGDIVTSFRHLSGVVQVEGDPADPNFGKINWSLAGDPESPLPSDFVLADGETFLQQHNPHLLATGQLTLFDNRTGLERSRVLDLTLDAATGIATVDRTLDMPGDVATGGHCDFQGAALRTEAGNPVGTCAPFRSATEFDDLSGAVVFTAAIDCRTPPGMYVPAFTPISE